MAHPPHRVRVPHHGKGQIGQGAEGEDLQAALPGGAQQGGHRLFQRGLPAGLQGAQVPHAVLAVYGHGGAVFMKERALAAGVDGGLGRRSITDGHQSVFGGLLQPYIAGHSGDAHHFHGGVSQHHDQGHGVVRTGIGVDPNLFCHLNFSFRVVSLTPA